MSRDGVSEINRKVGAAGREGKNAFENASGQDAGSGCLMRPQTKRLRAKDMPQLATRATLATWKCETAWYDAAGADQRNSVTSDMAL